MDTAGGVMAKGNCNVTLINNSIVYNQSMLQGGGICTHGDGGAATFSGVNNIIYFNTSYDDSQFGSAFGGGETYLTFSCISQELLADGNILDDPMFLNPDEDDFSLTEDSPCLDAGDPSSPSDPDGTIADMGALYYYHIVSVENNQCSILDMQLSNYPNPFNPSTIIYFSVTQTSSFVNLDIYNLKGQKVKKLVDEIYSAGNYTVLWDGKDDNGNNVSSGIYLYKLKAEDYTSTKKMILMK